MGMPSCKASDESMSLRETVARFQGVYLKELQNLSILGTHYNVPQPGRLLQQPNIASIGVAHRVMLTSYYSLS